MLWQCSYNNPNVASRKFLRRHAEFCYQTLVVHRLHQSCSKVPVLQADLLSLPCLGLGTVVLAALS